MPRASALVCCLLLGLIFRPAPGYGQPADEVNMPADPGYTGLWDMPNGRLMPDWHFRWGAGTSDPWYYIYFTLGLFDRLEINGRLTGIVGTPSGLGSDYGDYKDKAIDLKFTLMKEKGARPAVALGLTDIHGTGVFTSRYLAASKRFGRAGPDPGPGPGHDGRKKRRGTKPPRRESRAGQTGRKVPDQQ